jgi:His-Xaa-Ser system protein HxsD
VTEVCLTFSQEAQQEVPLRQAAYRIAGIAACHIDIVDGRWRCQLTAPVREAPTPEALRERFLAVLNDENLREKIEERTARLRDVIVALAFGALASGSKPGINPDVPVPGP